MRIDGGGRDNMWRVVVSFLCDELTQRQKETIMATSFKVGSDSITKIFILANPSYALQEWKKILYTWESIFYISTSFTYVGIDILSVEVLKKNKLFVDRCQKHQVQN